MNLPKFLICREDDDERGDRLFVLHCQRPRFLAEFLPGGEGEIELIDTDADATELSKARRAAREFFDGQ